VFQKIVISGCCPILVLTTVLTRLRRVVAKIDSKKYQGQTTSISPENTMRFENTKYLNFPHEFF
jgi:hypothetical protein